MGNNNILLKEIMVTKVVTVGPNSKVNWIEEKMRGNRIRHVPVVDADKKIVGIFTYSDLLSCSPPHRTEEGLVFDQEQMSDYILENVMTHDPQTLSPTDTLLHAVTIMVRDKYGCIPITDADGTLVGIVTRSDVLKWLHKHLGG